ncbi:MAG: hypothetical protein V9G98_22000 [Candidatus Competibacter sp.]
MRRNTGPATNKPIAQDPDDDRQPETDRNVVVRAAVAEQRGQGDQRNGGDVLKQQNPKNQLAGRGRE